MAPEKSIKWAGWRSHLEQNFLILFISFRVNLLRKFDDWFEVDIGFLLLLKDTEK